MRLRECAGGYAAFVSLGSTCQAAYQLRRLGLRAFAGPLDWFTSPSGADVARLLRSRFEGLMAFGRLQVIGGTAEGYTVRDLNYGIDSYHDFPYIPGDSVAVHYPGLQEKLRRRTAKLLEAARRGSILFVRTETNRQEAGEIRAALDELPGGRRSRLLIVNRQAGDGGMILEEDWGMDRVAAAAIPGGIDWRGSDAAWGALLRGFYVKIRS